MRALRPIRSRLAALVVFAASLGPLPAGDLVDLGYLAGYRAPTSEGGVATWDRDAVAPGAVLAVSAHRAGAELLARDGRLLHEWSLPFAQAFPGQGAGGGRQRGRRTAREPWWRRVRLLPEGDLVAVYEGRGLVRVDRDSRPRWARLGGFHHDIDPLPGGGLLVLDRISEPMEGGTRRAVRAHDRVVYLAADGATERIISLEEALRRSPWSELAAGFDGLEDPLHTNTLTLLDGAHENVNAAFKAGHLLLSFRSLDALAVLDPASESIVWFLRGAWKAQHEPNLLPGGRILLFDNRGLVHRSRALEVDASTGEILWSWTGGDLERFRCNQLGSVQPLAGGDVLVTDSMDGRAFQVTRGGRIVWRYDNPHRVEGETEMVAVLAEVSAVPTAELGWLRRRRSESP